MKHLGDITKISGYEAPTVEVMIGGSPCQDLSIAGRRAGLDGERSGLFMEQIRIIREMRENDRASGRTAESIRPRFMVWENVPGAFSSNKGEDFRVVLEETARVADPTAVIPRPPKGKWTTAGAIMGNGWSIAWRVFDAQFWGVPQRRRRIALVADFGGECAPPILFERESVSGYFEESGKERERTACDPEDSIGEASGAVCYCLQGNCIDRADTAGCNDKGWKEGVSYTLNTLGCDGNAAVFDARGNGDGNLAPTITGDHQNRITDYTAIVASPDIVGTLMSRDYKGPGRTNTIDRLVTQNTIVRRLTPLECERLQGFPSGWTDIGDWVDSKGKKHKAADSPRYKALGNSIALPSWIWVLNRLNRYCKEHTMASLFDGIGGFPLIWETLNGRGSCLWASEIEEFPIAVTKLRFGEVTTHEKP